MVVLTDYTVVEEDGKEWLSKAQCPSGTVELPPVDGIQSRCFESCGYLTSVIIPDTVTVIQQYAFFSCSSLRSITLPVHLTEMSEDSFYKCTSLVSVTMGVSVSPSKLPKTVKQIKIHLSTTVIPERFFARCVHLEEIELPESIEEIRDGAFEYCSSLSKVTCMNWGRSVDVPPKVKAIPCMCFYGCSSLKSVVIQESVTCIGSYAFSWCRNLSELIYLGKTELKDTTALPSGVTVYVDPNYSYSKLCGIKVSHLVMPMKGQFSHQEIFNRFNNTTGGVFSIPGFFHSVVTISVLLIVAFLCLCKLEPIQAEEYKEE